jgi:putative ABC transport system substrate-binding protein
LGLLVGGVENGTGAVMVAALREGLTKLGWIEGRNLTTDLHIGSADPDRVRDHAAELVSLAPDAIVTTPTAATKAVQQQTQTVPIVFLLGGDPVIDGVVRNIARPEANITGFSGFPPSIAGKWLELLKQVAPRLDRLAIIFNPEFARTGPI